MEANAVQPVFSPDGRWIAYSSGKRYSRHPHHRIGIATSRLEGRRVVSFVASGGENQGSLHVTLLMSFFKELRRKAGSGR
jgi:Tol biopolymer transport system component